MEVCLDEELPPTTELEEGLRNGVYLAKLAKFFAPNVVSDKKIYDVEQARYKVIIFFSSPTRMTKLSNVCLLASKDSQAWLVSFLCLSFKAVGTRWKMHSCKKPV